jgi:hypothetical protein
MVTREDVSMIFALLFNKKYEEALISMLRLLHMMCFILLSADYTYYIQGIPGMYGPMRAICADKPWDSYPP